MNKTTLWVIDDDFIFQTIAKKIIQKTGVFTEPSAFTNGKEAIDALKKALENNAIELPNIILLDINMPVMDGWEFMEEFIRLKHNLKDTINIYIVSSSIAVEDREKAASYTDIMGYLAKPVTVSDLLAITSK
jgi:CheY-like chemotaxis protein